MKLARLLLTTSLMLVCAICVAAQTESKDSPKDWPKDWKDQWQFSTGNLLRIAEAMPADKYDYKPVKEVDTFGDQVKHATLAIKVLINNAEGKNVNTTEAFAAMQKLTKKEEIVAEFRKVAEEGAAVVVRISGKNDGEVVESQFFGKTTRRFLLIQAIGHNYNHYGQLVYYLRLNGITPPASR